MHLLEDVYVKCRFNILKDISVITFTENPTFTLNVSLLINKLFLLSNKLLIWSYVQYYCLRTKDHRLCNQF